MRMVQLTAHELSTLSKCCRKVSLFFPGVLVGVTEMKYVCPVWRWTPGFAAFLFGLLS